MFSCRTSWDLAPNRYSTAAAAHRAAGRELLDLTESNPTRGGLRYPEPEILKSFLHPGVLQYQPEPRGFRSAREAVASYYASRGKASAPVDPDHIVLTTSTSEAYSFLFRLLCDPGDEVLVATPSYPLFDYLAGLDDVKLVPYELVYDHAWQLDFHSLERAITPRTRAVMVVHPNNPTGSYLQPTEMDSLDDLCAKRELAIVADEVFLDYDLEDQPNRSFCAGDRETLTFTLSGLSKIAALPQMKVAWIVANGPAAPLESALARLEVIADTFLSMSTPLQLAVPNLLAVREQMTAQLLQRLKANLAALDSQLAKQKLVQRLHVEGGWYAVLRIPARGSDEDFAINLLEQKGVLVQPGHFYDLPRDGFLVLSLITPADVFAEGVGRLLTFTAAS